MRVNPAHMICRSVLAAFFGLLAGVAGCRLDVDELIDDGGGVGRTEPVTGAPGGVGVPVIRDGTSNTIGIGETPTSADASQGLRARLADRLFEFASSSGNSDNNAFVTGVSELQLCAFGRFGLRETTSFASQVGDFSSEDLSFGTWSLRQSGGRLFIDLTVDRTSDQNAPRVRTFEVAVDTRTGVVAIDGQRATEFDVSADCAEAAAQP